MITTYVGTYTDHIDIFQFDPETGQLHSLGKATGVISPSFLTISADNKFLYAVQEIGDFNNEKSGAVTSFSVDQNTKQLTLLNSQATHGEHPCYISIDASGKWLLTANYSSGNVTVFPLLSDGTIGLASDVVQQTNTIDTDTPSHPHCIIHEPKGDWIFVADTGFNRIAIYRLNKQTGKLEPNDPPHITLPPGTGPRHVVFHPKKDILYSMNETNLTVTTYDYNSPKGFLHPIQTLTTLPEQVKEGFSGADIHIDPNGKFLYASNRGHDSIAIFSINDDGTLTSISHHPSGGKTPRGFAIDPAGNWLLVGNQDSDIIKSYRINQKTGTLTDGPTTYTSKPVCIRIIES